MVKNDKVNLSSQSCTTLKWIENAEAGFDHEKVLGLACAATGLCTTLTFKKHSSSPTYYLSLHSSIQYKMSSKSSLTYGKRAESHPNAVLRKLFELAEAKESNVVVSADLTTTKELLHLADGKLFPGSLRP